MEFGIEKCAILQMKSGKRETIEPIKLPNQESIRKLGGKENYECLGILGVDIIKLTEIKKKYEKCISEEQETFLKQNSATEISSKE